jgi:hypothetical protein
LAVVAGEVKMNKSFFMNTRAQHYRLEAWPSFEFKRNGLACSISEQRRWGFERDESQLTANILSQYRNFNKCDLKQSTLLDLPRLPAQVLVCEELVPSCDNICMIANPHFSASKVFYLI